MSVYIDTEEVGIVEPTPIAVIALLVAVALGIFVIIWSVTRG